MKLILYVNINAGLPCADSTRAVLFGPSKVVTKSDTTCVAARVFPTEGKREAGHIFTTQMVVWAEHEWTDAESHSIRTYDRRAIACQLR